MVYPMANGMSGHDAQIIILHDITVVNDTIIFTSLEKLLEQRS